MERFLLIMEIWKDIPGYEGIYQASNYGQIKRLQGFNGRYKNTEHILKPTKGKNGYFHICLFSHCIGKHFAVHKLIASLFISNPEKYRCVNHKNEIKTDNRAENLEWCDHYYNNHYSKLPEKKYKPVICFTLYGKKIKRFISIKDAAENMKINPSNIGSCCNNKRKSAGGYKWEYAK